VAAELRATQPDMKVHINPPGRRKVSDMIWQVAEPRLESAPDYESKEMLLKLTTLACPIEQQEMFAEMLDLFQSPEGMNIFCFSSPKRNALSTRSKRSPHYTAIWHCELHRRCKCNHSRLRPCEESFKGHAKAESIPLCEIVA
jgi:hypothetical protein